MHWGIGRLSFLGIGLCLLLTSCGPKENQPHTYLIPWFDNQGRYRLQEVEITTLHKPDRMDGHAAKIYFNSRLGDRGYLGPVARPSIVKSGGVWVPTDVSSAQTLTMYALMEHLYFWDAMAGYGSLLSWPRAVGLYSDAKELDGSDLHDNARYSSSSDTIAVVPYTLSRLPLAVNAGVIAHEHFHALFNSAVLKTLFSINELQRSHLLDLEDMMYPHVLRHEQKATPTVVTTCSGKKLTAFDFNLIVLRGWNEGLADFYAAMFTRRAQFMADSFPEKIAAQRALDQQPEAIPTASEFTNVLEGKGTGSYAGECSPLASAYRLGTNVARVLFKIYGLETMTFLADDPQRLGREQKMIRLLLKRLPALVEPLSKDLENQFVSPQFLIQALFGAQESWSPEVCQILQANLDPLSFTSEIPGCH